jgi:hypothetical protein
MKAAVRYYEYVDHAAERPIPEDSDLASGAGVLRAAFLGGLAWAVLLFVIFAG